MLYVKNKQGRAIEITIYGESYDDLQIEEAYYLDDSEEDVTDTDIEYIMNNYGDEMYEEYINNVMCAADFYNDQLKEEGY